jgi:hypothetical protein
MKTRNYFIIAITVAFVALLVSCGNGRSPSQSTRTVGTPAVAQSETVAVERPDLFSNEDRMVMAMTLEQRITYLEQKLKEKLWERYGITVDESPPNPKNTSLVDDYNKVCAASGGNSKEDLELIQTPSKWEWTLSFLDRLSGDYNFDHVVNMDDLDPIADEFGHVRGGLMWLDIDDDIDRLANEDGEISIADVTPLALNFGHELVKYNLYWQDSAGGAWRLIGEWDDSHCTYEMGNPPDSYRGKWEGAFTKKSVYWDTLDYTPVTIDTVTNTDRLYVKPVFYVDGQDEVQDVPSDTLDIAWSGTNTAPVAEITADPMQADLDEQVDFDASGSTDTVGDTLSFEWDYDVSDGYQWDDTETTPTSSDSYDFNAYKTVTVCVTDQVGDWDTDTVEIVVYEIADPEPPTIISFKASPEAATLPATITLTTEAQDRDAGIVESISFDPDGDSTYEDVFTDQDEEFTVNNPGFPPGLRTYTAAYDHVYNRSDDCISDSNHTTSLACRSKATDNDDGDGAPSLVLLQLTHASPIINSVSITNKVGMSSPDDPNDPVTVTVDASDASDPDGTNAFPTRFVFDWGPGEGTTTESYGDAGFDGIATHDYDDPGVYQVTVTCYDDDDSTVMDGECTDVDAHVYEYPWPSDEDGRVHIWSTPQLRRNEVIDGGLGWSNLGDPSIAIAINPATRLPGVVYHGTYTNHGQNDPLEVAKYSAKLLDVNGWTAPEMVWTGYERAEHLGYQCDLEYHPTVQYPSYQFPYVAQYFYNQFPSIGMPGGPGIKLFTKMNGTWTSDLLTNNVYVNTASPIRLVVNNMGSYVQFLGQDVLSRPLLREIEYESGINCVTVQTIGAGTAVGMSHDLKEYQDDYSGTQNVRASLYTTDSASDDDVQYEVWTGSDWGGSNPALNTDNINTGTTRHVALDYLDDSKIGAIWLASDSDLKWAEYETSWSTEIDLDSGVDNWCDFDYEPTTQIPCVAYEKDGEINFLAYYEGDWQGPMTIATLGQGMSSHLDLEASDGCAYVAYSNFGRIYCAVVDFCDR